MLKVRDSALPFKYYKGEFKTEYESILQKYGERNYKDKNSNASWHKELKCLAAKALIRRLIDRFKLSHGIYDEILREWLLELKY